MKVNKFDLDEVCTFLTAIGLGEKTGPFRENDVDGDLLCSLTIEDYTAELGLTSLQAKKLLRSIDEENNAGAPNSGSSEATLQKMRNLEAENAELKKQIVAVTADIQAIQAEHNPPAAKAGKSNYVRLFKVTIYFYVGVYIGLST
jgi:hypothetical protein